MTWGAIPRARAERWRGVALERVAEMVADDLDTTDRRIYQMQSDIDRELEGFKKDVQSVKRMLLSILVSTTIAALLLAANLTVGVGR
jgi:hypothetical protein